MGLYGFKRRFAPKIKARIKLHTIRADRADGWVEKPGNIMHLYTGLRQKGAELLGRPVCARVQRIEIGAEAPEKVFPVVTIDGINLDRDEKEALAKADGFETFDEMIEFFDGRLPFAGNLIHWRWPDV